jgi:hypothetical protein
MKVAAFTALHYGLDYLPYAIRSVVPFVDEWLIAYSPIGSHGYRTSVHCPEKVGPLFDCANAVTHEFGVPLRWWSSTDWPHEGFQRDSVYQHTDADLIIVVDADEVWQDGAVQQAIEHGKAMDVRHGRVPFIHFWRSFNWACRDDARPIRLLRPGLPMGDYYADVDPVLHFGYAQTEYLTVYKWFVHGHKAELRQGWHDNTFKYWSPLDGPFQDLHPTNKDYWTAEPYARSKLPKFMRSHPFYDKEIIK